MVNKNKKKISRAENRSEAEIVAELVIKDLRPKTYNELKSFISEIKGFNTIGKSGEEYSGEIEAFWDGEENGNLRVMVSVDYRKKLFFQWSITRSFIISPDNKFVGE